MKPIPIEIRPMIRRDFCTVLTIEGRSFRKPWEEEDFVRCLRLVHCNGKVATQDDAVVGYVVYLIERSYLDIINLAVSPCFRREGIGMELLADLVSRLSNRRSQIRVRVPDDNLAAHLFFRAMGFHCYAIDREDYLFRWLLKDAEVEA